MGTRSERATIVATRKARVEVCEDQFESFEWNEVKRLRNLKVHGIDFEDAAAMFFRPYLRMRSDRHAERRFVAIGLLEDLEIAVVYTVRDRACRIISARRARRYERTEYHQALRTSTEER